MKKLLIFFSLLVTQINFAQDAFNSKNDTIYLMPMADKKPEFEGGKEALLKCITENFTIPKIIDFKGGKIISTFTVNIDGSIEDIKILKDPGFDTCEEMKRLLSICNKWVAGEIKGQKVRINYTLPIVFPAYEPVIEDDLIKKDSIYSSITLNKKPEFKGGIEAFFNFISKNYIAPQQPNLKGKIIISFVIEKDGSLVDIKILKDIGYGTGQEAIRVLKKSPKWIPAEKDGIPVRCSYQIPIAIETSN